MDSRSCKFPGCIRVPRSGELCLGHQRQRRLGHELSDLGPGKGATLSEKIDYYSMPVTESGCIIWTGADNGHGYGRINHAGQMLQAHRAAWGLAHGDLSAEQLLDHRCGVRSCVNIDHLRLATKSQNGQHRVSSASGNASGHRNVYPYRQTGRWFVSLTKGGRAYYFGSYADIEDAARVASEKRREIYGEFAGVDR